MAIKAVEHTFDGLTVPYTSYDSTKTNLGATFRQTEGKSYHVRGSEYSYAGPNAVLVARPYEMNGNVATGLVYVLERSPTESWIFLGDASTAAATRRVFLYILNKTTQELAYKGQILMTFPSATNHTMRGLAVALHTRSNNTVAVSGTAVTGTSTTWQTNRYAVGARMGFGTTDPTAVTTWYHTSAIASDTGITLVENAGTVAGGSSYVIEELRIYVSTTNATLANGGLFVVKGCTIDDFTPQGTTFSAATNTDNIKAVYWLADASTVLNTVACGLAMDSTQSDTQHYLWVPNTDGAAQFRIYKYDGRVALAGLASGKSTSAFVFRTGQEPSFGGDTVAPSGNGIIVTRTAGTGRQMAGEKDFYIISIQSNGQMRGFPESNITNGSTTFMQSGTSSTQSWVSNTPVGMLLGTLSHITYDSVTDTFLIVGTTASPSIISRWIGPSDDVECLFQSTNVQIESTTAECGLAPYPNNGTSGAVSTTNYATISAGLLYYLRSANSALTNILHIVPLSADWEFAAGDSAAKQQRLITPSLSTTGCVKFYRLGVNSARLIGSPNLGLQPEPFRVYYRTSGISDDSGGWTLLDDDGDLTGITAANSIQFMFEFKMFGPLCIPARIINLCCTFEDGTTDSHYEPSVANSDTTNEMFAWRFAKAFGTTTPTLTLRIYDAVTGDLLLTDDTATPTEGAFEKSTNGGSSWAAYNTTDKANDITYIRYTPTDPLGDVKARALLTQ